MENNNNGIVIISIVLLALVIFGVWFYVKKIKHLIFPNVVLVTGGVKSGKTTLNTALAIKQFKRVTRQYKFRCFIIRTLKKVFKKKFKDVQYPERPLFYTNIPVKIDYVVPLTWDLLLRRKRFTYKSVILVSESSLVADSMMIKDKEINKNLLLFNKLIAHMTKGGYLFYETQSLSDNHFSVKRVLSSYYRIQSCIKWVPFVLLFKVREMAYSADDSSITNVFNQDSADDNKYLVISKKIWKKFDCYNLSALTDGLEVVDKYYMADDIKDLKVHNLLSYIDKY